MKTNNLRNEIKEFIKDFCLEITDDNQEEINEHYAFVYEGVEYYIPEETSLMSEDDALLAMMLVATFPLADE